MDEKSIKYNTALANAADTQQLAFSIMGLLPFISVILWFSVPAGPVGMVWFSASTLIFVIGLAIMSITADLGSLLLTSGAERYKNPLSFLIRYSNTIGFIGGICLIDYGFASFIVSLGTISSDGEWIPSRGQLYAIFVATVLCHGLLATSAGRVMHHLQTWFVVANFALIVATIIALPVSMRLRNIPINSGSYVFSYLVNETTWPSGWAFMLSWLSPIWTIGAFNSCVHISEEAKNPTKAVPISILALIGGCWIFGFLVTAVLAACASSNFKDILGTPFASRQTWAFSRDGPLRTVWATCLTAIIIGLLSLINNAAANALFSLAAAGNNKFCPGPFYTGRFSVAILIAALVYLTFATILYIFPTKGPYPDQYPFCFITRI
ncbi:amino acid/polyamine transporter I [Trichoderma compactum]